MGLLTKWRERRTKRKAFARLRTALDGAVGGKDVDELVREGGWDVLGKTFAAKDGAWESFTTRELEGIMRLSSVVYACVHHVCTSAPQAYMEIGEWDGDEWEPDVDHHMLELFRQPNPTEDWRMFLWSLISHLLLTGVSYTWKKKDPAGVTQQMHALPTSWVVPKYKNGRMTNYDVAFGGDQKPTPVPLEDMIVMAYPDPGDPNAGLGPMQAALRDYQIDDKRSSMMIEVLTNTHFASAVLKQKGYWTPDQMREIRAALRDLIGPGKRGEPVFLGGEGSSIEFPQPKSDMDWPGTATLAETRICSTFGVPPILIGLRSGLQSATYSNYAQAKAAFYTDTMVPLWDWIASTFERGLFRSEGFEEEVEADYEHITELQEDIEKQHTRVRADFHGGLLTLNRALELIGEETLEDDGDVRVLPMNLVPFEAGGDGPPAAPPHDGAEPDEDEER